MDPEKPPEDVSERTDSKADIDVAAINDFYKQIVPFDTSMFQGTWQTSNEDAEDQNGMLMQTFDLINVETEEDQSPGPSEVPDSAE